MPYTGPVSLIPYSQDQPLPSPPTSSDMALLLSLFIYSFNGYFSSLCYGHWGYFSKTDSVPALMVGDGLLACLQSQVPASMTCCLLVSSPSPACRGPCRTVSASTVTRSQHSMCILHSTQRSGKSFGSFVCIYCLSSSTSVQFP